MSENTPVPAPKPEPAAAPAQTPAQVPGAAAGSAAAALAAPATTPGAPDGPGGKQARAGRLEGELQKLRSELRAGAKAIMRVLPPHSSMTWAGRTVTSEPTEVPVSAVAGLHEAALNAGVELIQES